MSQCKFGIHHAYSLHCIWIEAQGIHTQNHGPSLYTQLIHKPIYVYTNIKF